MNCSPRPESGNSLDIVRDLLAIAGIDTLFRALYLSLAYRKLSSVLTEEGYRHLKDEKTRLDGLVLKSRGAIEHNDWKMVQELVDAIRPLKQTIQSNQELLDIGKNVYDADVVCIDPFSPGLQSFLSFAHRSRVDLREGVIRLLENLGTRDAANATFYRTRLAWYNSRSTDGPDVQMQTAIEAPEADSVEKALSAVADSDFDRLELLARKMTQHDITVQPAVSYRSDASHSTSALSGPFPDSAVAKAQALGLVPLRIEAEPEVSTFLHQWAWQPGFPDPTLTQDGKIIIQGGLPERVYPPGTSEQRQATLDLFLIHPYITSGGARYIPSYADEVLLVENFPEQEPDSRSPLLMRLNLPGRKGLCRHDIEMTLLRHGKDIIRSEIGLDPLQYRLICIPYDVYCRISPRFGVGSAQQWTHFDGYQVLGSGAVRALVGGDIRFGGAYDLCSINPYDAREGLIVRFAVVRIQRLYPW